MSDLDTEMLGLLRRMLEQSSQSSWLHMTSGDCDCKRCTKEQVRRLIQRVENAAQEEDDYRFDCGNGDAYR